MHPGPITRKHAEAAKDPLKLAAGSESGSCCVRCACAPPCAQPTSLKAVSETQPAAAGLQATLPTASSDHVRTLRFEGQLCQERSEEASLYRLWHIDLKARLRTVLLHNSEESVTHRSATAASTSQRYTRRGALHAQHRQRGTKTHKRCNDSSGCCTNSSVEPALKRRHTTTASQGL